MRGKEPVVVVDVGATWTRIGIAKYSIKNKKIILNNIIKIKTPRGRDGNSVASSIAESITSVWRESNAAAVSIASFGPLAFPAGDIVSAPNHPAGNIPLGSRVRELLPEQLVLVSNDAVAGAWGVYNYFRFNRYGIKDMVYIALGTGIGVGVIVNKRLLLGRRGDSHEAGHIVLDYNSDLMCGCRGRGHWEALGSGSSLSRMRVSRDVARRALAAGIASLVACYDPEFVVLDGGLVENNIIAIDGSLKELVREYSFQGRVPEIVLSPFLGRSNLMGAYFIARIPDETLWGLNGWLA